MKLIFGLSFVTGVTAGLANWSTSPSDSASAASSDEAESASSDSFNPGAGNGGGTGSVNWGLPFPNLFDDFDPAGNVQDLVTAGTWTQEMAWMDYEITLTVTEGWISWNDYVNQLNADFGVDYSEFSAPPGGNTPPGGTIPNNAGSGATNPGWNDPGLSS